MRLEKVKTLISDGKTQQAIDLLQEILEGKNTELLNQTLLLEGQFKDLQKKMQLGLHDATVELNRINFTVLSVCDDAASLPNIGEDIAEKPFTDAEKPQKAIGNTLAIMGVLAAIAIAVFVGLYFLLRDTTPKRAIMPEIETLPSVTPNAVTPSVKDPDLTWFATTPSATITEKNYGNLKADAVSIKATALDADTKILSIDLKLNCVSSLSGKCLLNYLEFRLIGDNNDKIAPKDEVNITNNPKDGGSVTNKVSFVVPKSLKHADLQLNYKGKLATSLATIHLNGAN
jgi:Effector-associated domain 11